jgi:hypothetical protein
MAANALYDELKCIMHALRLTYASGRCTQPNHIDQLLKLTLRAL